jgi:hypothetical protein
VAFPAPLLNLARRWRTAGLAFALVTIVAGTRWAVIDRFGSDLPAADQWDGEAWHTLLPWFEGDHFLAHLAAPHNEHRVILTKLQALAEVLLTGQWDARVQTAANAVLAALFISAFWLTVRRWTTPAGGVVLAGIAALAFSLPLAWENILGGFHSQQWWLIGLSALAILHWPFARPWSPRWWFGAVTAVLALGSMAPGFVAAGIVAILVADRWRRAEITVREATPTLALAGLVVAAGLVLRVEFPPHEPLKAGSVAEFLTHFLRSLQWPWRGQVWAGIVLWVPVVAIALRFLRSSGDSASRPARTLTALGAWTLLQLAATSYARGAGANYPAPRYVDTLAFGILVNAAALVWLVLPKDPPSPTPARGAQTWKLFAGVWALVFVAGLIPAAQRVLSTELPAARRFSRAAEDHLRGYLATNDPAELAGEEIPFPSVEGLVWRLSRPALRDRMPVSVRAPLLLDEGGTSAPAFTRNLVPQPRLKSGSRLGLSPATPPYGSHSTWGSFGRGGAAERGTWISASLRSPPGWLKFETAGHLGQPGVALELHDAQNGGLVGVVQPSRVPGDGWRAAYVRAPQRPFVVVARDEDSSRWLAFSAPVAMSTGSYAAWQLARHGLLVAWVGAFTGLLPTLLSAVAARQGAAAPDQPA